MMVFSHRIWAGVFCATLLLAVSARPASTVGPPQPGTFAQTDLDAGGWLTGFASHSGGRLYARTDVGGAYRSDDHGATWQFLSGDMTSAAGLFVQGLAVGENSADLVFQAVGTSYADADTNRGVWRTTDGGTTWEKVLGDVLFSGNDDLRWQGECLAMRPGSNDLEILAITRKSGLWRSTTGGGVGTWAKQGGRTFDKLVGHVVHMHPSFPNEIFVGGEKGSGPGALYRGVRRSNGAIAWKPVKVSAKATAVTRLARLSNGVMFAAVRERSGEFFYMSNTKGAGWKNITARILGTDFANGPVGMCHVLRDNATVVVSWLGGPTRKSTDGGLTWTSVPLSITGTRPVAMLTSETAPSWARGSLHQDPLDANRWYLPNGFGPFVSTDAGATANYMTAGIGEVVTWKPSWHPNDPNRVYLPVADLIGFVATDGAGTGAGLRNPRRSLPVVDGNVGMTYATRALVGPAVGNAAPKVYFVGGSFFGPNAGCASILTTSDDGVTWSLVHVAGQTGTGLPAASEIVGGCVAPDNANEILVAVHDTSGEGPGSGIYRSTDGGVNFTKSGGVPAGGYWGDEFERAAFLDADTANTFRRFAWLNNVGFLVSNDRGLTWSSVGHDASGPAAMKLYDWNKWGCLARDRVTGRLWFGGAEGHLGLAYSDNNGANWTYLDQVFSNTGFSEVRSVDAHDGQVLVCGRRFGDLFTKIYYSGDNGSVWRECTKAGYRLPNASEVALNPHQRGHFWVATNGRSYARFSPLP